VSAANHLPEIDPRFNKYKFRKSTHEAGYDSMLAAMAFIKLAGNIRRGGSEPLAKASPPKTTAPSLVAGVMASPSNQSTPRCEFSNFFDTENELIPTIPAVHIAESGTSLADPGSEHITCLVNQSILLPRLGDTFWDVYGNILRVFGTQERVVKLGEVPKKMEELLLEL
jgi:poly(A)-specific ribonuclease